VQPSCFETDHEKGILHMAKRAVIYVRTSSEQQAEKNSPIEQEADCRQLAEQKGFVVVNIYRDTERYRVRNKWVEPSGTRYDRPGLLAMLRDAADDQFDVILAWREDRLYRGMRAMLLVLEAIQQHKLTVLLARETFDLATAPLKAWLAQVELEHIKERMTMGVKARLRAGKANSGQDRYGYCRKGEVIEIIPEEAQWVRQIFEWYIEGVPMKTMRKHLIDAGAPQKSTYTPRQIHWSVGAIGSILQGAEDYATGVKIQRREGESFSIQHEPILNMKTYERYLEVKQKYTFPDRNIPRDDFLLRGLLFCPCNYRMQVQINRPDRKSWDGQWAPGKLKGIYLCSCRHEELVSPDCPGNVNHVAADAEVWRQVSAVINQPDILVEQARLIVEDLREHALLFSSEKERLEKTLSNLFLDRQWVITQARKSVISADEMEAKLKEMSLMEVRLKGELLSLQQTIDESLLTNWEGKVRQYLDDLQDGLQELNSVPETPQGQSKILDLKRRTLEMLVEKIVVDRTLQYTVTIRLDLLNLLEKDANAGGSTNPSGGNLPSDHPGKRFAFTGKKLLTGMRFGQIRITAAW
jgi:DNA invertase Pin-like site-specific DNA recombinase